MAEDTENPIYHHDTLEFVTVAAQFCAYLEQSQGRERGEFVEAQLRVLPLLYLKSTLIPEVETEGDFVPDDQVTEDDYNWIRGNIYAIMGEKDEYEELCAQDAGVQESWDRMPGEETMWRSVSENLADTYQALRNFVAAYQQGIEECMRDALWAVRDNFELYWGDSVLSCLRYLHSLRYVNHTGQEDEEDR